MDNERPEPGKQGGKAPRSQAKHDQRKPSEPFAYSIDDICKSGPWGRSFIYDEIKAGRLIARKARGRTIILPSDMKAYLAALPTTKASGSETEPA